MSGRFPLTLALMVAAGVEEEVVVAVMAGWDGTASPERARLGSGPDTGGRSGLESTRWRRLCDEEGDEDELGVPSTGARGVEYIDEGGGGKLRTESALAFGAERLVARAGAGELEMAYK